MSGGGGTGLIVMPDRSDEVMIVPHGSHVACAILSRRHPLQIVPPPHRNSDFCTVHDVASVQSRPRSPAHTAPCWHAPAAAVPLLHVLCRRVTRSPFRLLPCSQALPDCDRQTIQMMNRRKPENVPTSVALRARVSRAQPPAPTVTRV